MESRLTFFRPNGKGLAAYTVNGTLHEQALMDFCSRGMRRPPEGSENDA